MVPHACAQWSLSLLRRCQQSSRGERRSRLRTCRFACAVCCRLSTLFLMRGASSVAERLSRSSPARHRDRSTRSSIIRACFTALRSMISSACDDVPSTVLFLNKRAQPRIALNGVRNSCDTLSEQAVFGFDPVRHHRRRAQVAQFGVDHECNIGHHSPA